jgi:hypothetical protein
LNVPVAVGEPEIVMVLPDQLAVTPAGKLVAAPIPVAPVVVWEMEIGVPVHTVGLEEAAETVFTGIV